MKTNKWYISISKVTLRGAIRREKSCPVSEDTLILLDLKASIEETSGVIDARSGNLDNLVNEEGAPMGRLGPTPRELLCVKER